MALQRLLDQGCMKREMFDIKKLLVSKNGSRKKIMHLIRNISRLPPVEWAWGTNLTSLAEHI